MTWGAAQLGVASGVLDAVADGIISSPTDLLLIAAVWVDPDAQDADLVYSFNREATRASLARGADESVDVAALLAVRDVPINGYYVPPTLR